MRHHLKDDTLASSANRHDAPTPREPHPTMSSSPAVEGGIFHMIFHRLFHRIIHLIFQLIFP